MRGVVENDKTRVRILGGPSRGAHQGVLKVPKWPQNYIPRGRFWSFKDLWDPLVDTPGVLTLVYHFLLLPCIISV